MKKGLFILLIFCFSLTVFSCSEEEEEYTATGTTDSTTTDSTTYNYFTGSTVTVNFLKSDNSLMGESGFGNVFI